MQIILTQRIVLFGQFGPKNLLIGRIIEINTHHSPKLKILQRDNLNPTFPLTSLMTDITVLVLIFLLLVYEVDIWDIVLVDFD